MQQIISLLLENKPGALMRVTATDAALGQALNRRVVTGNRCVFLAP